LAKSHDIQKSAKNNTIKLRGENTDKHYPRQTVDSSLEPQQSAKHTVSQVHPIIFKTLSHKSYISSPIRSDTADMSTGGGGALSSVNKRVSRSDTIGTQKINSNVCMYVTTTTILSTDR
jgi:hypothetical protein